MVEKLVNPALNNCLLSLEDGTDQPTRQKEHLQSAGRSRTGLKITRICLKVFNITLNPNSKNLS